MEEFLNEPIEEIPEVIVRGIFRMNLWYVFLRIHQVVSKGIPGRFSEGIP